MYLTLRLAWRNIFRNTRRTFLAGSAIGVGIAAMMLADGFMRGMVEGMVKSATESYMGHAQAHAPEFRKSMEVEKTFTGLPEIRKKVASTPGVRDTAFRIRTFAMASSPANMVSVMLNGIEAEHEQFPRTPGGQIRQTEQRSRSWQSRQAVLSAAAKAASATGGVMAEATA